MKTNIFKGMLILVGLLIVSSAGMAQAKKQKSQVKKEIKQIKQLDKSDFLKKKSVLLRAPRIIATAGGSIIIVPSEKSTDEKTKRQNFLDRWAQYNLGGTNSNPVGKYYPSWQYKTISCPPGYRLPTFVEIKKLLSEYTIYIQRDLGKNPGGKDGLWIGMNEETCKKADKNNFNGCVFLPVTNFYSEPYGWSNTLQNYGFYMTSSLNSNSRPMLKAMCFSIDAKFDCYEHGYMATEPNSLYKDYLFVRPITK
ncbi:hypothetical protein [Gabonibacter massiliensis]|uniref:hypothetical protein n=1 Tax=Gabonibacter massiliensis TaxID=1720195 RepID=UPI00073E6F3F|nr:hypothetical protein [Gabonibacter massiliensis]